MAKHTANDCVAEDWLDDDKLMLLECWMRDGYTYQDIANKIGINMAYLFTWRKKYPEIDKALKAGKEIVDYKVENALLKSALGYKTKEVKVTTIMRNGKVVETQREVLEREEKPNVAACQTWLFNRLPDKWKRNRDSILGTNEEEDTNVQITITRASKNELKENENKSEEDTNWEQEVNESVTVKPMNEEEKKKYEKEKAKKKREDKRKAAETDKTKVVFDEFDEDWDDK